MAKPDEDWPALPLRQWQPTYATLHLWTQVVGKIRTKLTPLINHWWNSTLYLTARGLTTSAIPYGSGAFEIRFDFLDHKLRIDTSWGAFRTIELVPQPCCDFYAAVMSALKQLGIEVEISPVSQELPKEIRLDLHREHASYDAKAVERWFHILLRVAMILTEFRARFIGKSSPVHFFWGSFDLAVSSFNGKRAPHRDGAGKMMNEAYSHETSSVGFWPGSGSVTDAAFFAYTAPAPAGLESVLVQPPAAHYDKTLGEFILMYDDMRKSASPRQALLDFAQSAYEAGANLAGWNRAELERSE